MIINDKEKNYELLSILEEDKRFWITNLITSISAIIGLIYYLISLNVHILKMIYECIRNAGTLDIIHEIISLPKYDITAWIIIIFLRLFLLGLIFPSLDILFKNEKKNNRTIGLITLILSFYLILRYRSIGIYYVPIFFFTVLDIVGVLGIESNILENFKSNRLKNAKLWFLELNKKVEENERKKRNLYIGFYLRELFYFVPSLVILINLIHMERPEFEFLKIRLESYTILLLILIISTRWIRPSYDELNKILSQINKIRQ